jgi:VIT1/CCC1 family predicted Fe2+/Mn2+ transporter
VSQYIAAQALVERSHRLADELHPLDKLDERGKASTLEHELIKRGIGRASSQKIGAALVTDGLKASTTLGMIRYGFNGRDRSSPLRAAATTLVASVAGALVPIVPWFFNGGRNAVIESLALSGVAAAIIGGILGRLSSGHVVAGAARQVALVLLAAGVTYGIGVALQGAGVFGR